MIERLDPRSSADRAAEWDYVVVGGGSAGCVLASRLTENPANRVLLLNAGRGFIERTPLVQVPAGALYYDHPILSWSYRSELGPTGGDRSDPFYAGRILGGGSSVNGMMFIRGHHDDYNDWAREGNAGWAYEDLLPFFRKIEHTLIGSEEFHGRDGPLGVELATPMLDISERFIRAAIEVGIPHNPDINGASLEGITRTPTSAYKGVRQSTSQAYLRHARKRPNLKVLSGALARRILIDGRIAIGVEFERSGRIETAFAAREIILSAGAVRSPQILMLSGIGDPSELRQHDIPVVHSLPGVGKNFMDHSVLHMTYAVALPTWCREMSLPRQALHGLRCLLWKSGPAQSGVSQAVAFVRTSSLLDRPDVQITFIPMGPPRDTLGVRKRHRDVAMVFVDECRPKSRGSVRLRSADIHDAPHISFNIFEHEESLGVIANGIGIARRIMSASAIGPYVEQEIFPGPEAAGGHRLTDWIRSSATSMQHVSGTCKMGQGPDAVVDECLRVRGINRLRIADASIMPDIPSGNINAPTIMIGEKAASLIETGRNS